MRRGRVQVDEGTSAHIAGRAAARSTSRVAVLLPPWALWLVTLLAGWLLHKSWGQDPSLTWIAVAATAFTCGLAFMTWTLSRNRGDFGRVHATVTVAAVGGWVIARTVAGWEPAVSAAFWWGGAALALSWNIRSIVRADGDDGDPLAKMITEAAPAAGMAGVRGRTKEVGAGRRRGVLALPRGHTHDEVQKSVDKLESAAGLPPGSITTAPDLDRADLAEITVSDPRVLRNPIPWRGPSLPGQSIAKPLRIGLWQDGETCTFNLTHNLQIMGRSGSGKSFGGGWNILGEVITRYDQAVFAIDISKDEQTLGPLRPALARCETSVDGAVKMLRAIYAEIPKRTAALAQRKLSKWEEGCGLDFWVVWIEEMSKFVELLPSRDEDLLENLAKEIRSAGGAVVDSLQRADYSQIPTIIRGQMDKMCFGVEDSDDAGFGLSTRQRQADSVTPERWGKNYPGMFYLDASGVSERHAVMAARTFDWAGDYARMEQHARTFAAARARVRSGREWDEFTAKIRAMDFTLKTPSPTPRAEDEFAAEQEEFVGDVAGDELAEAAAEDADLADPDPELTASLRPDSPIQYPTEDEAAALFVDTPPERMSPQEARAEVMRWLDERFAAGQVTFRASDDEVAELRHRVGMKRGWIYKVLAELVLAERLEKNGITYRIMAPSTGVLVAV